MAVFPNGSDALPTNITPNTPESGIHADLHNKTSDAVNAVEAALLPGGSIDVSIAGKAPTVHSHVEGDVTNLTTDLAGKALTVHTHTEANVTNLTTDLAAKAAAVHTHVEGDVTALTTDLAATEKTVNKNANGGYAGLDANGKIGVSRLLTTGVASATTFLRGDAVWATPAGGGGGSNAPWQFAPDFQAPQSGDYAQMRCSVATSVTAFGAQRTGGTGANIDVLKNGVSILTAPLSLTATTFTAGTLTANPTTFAIGDIIKIVVSAQTGSPADIMTSADGSRVTF